MEQVTRILNRIERGEYAAAEELLPLVYEELRKLAASRLSLERPGQTLEPSALVHEAYLRLVDVERVPRWEGRGHFFAAAAEAMRRILVENARRKRRMKHGGGRKRVALEGLSPTAPETSHDLIELDHALTRLQIHDPQASRLVELRHFAGLSVNEAANVLGISSRSADRLWAFARAWLYREITSGSDS